MPPINSPKPTFEEAYPEIETIVPTHIKRLRRKSRHEMINGEMHRLCTMCDTMFPLSSFLKKANGKYRSQCLACRRKENTIWRKNNPDKIRKNSAASYRRNHKERRSRQSQWYIKNRQKERIRAKNRHKERLKNDFEYLMIHRLRKRLSAYFRNLRIYKSAHTLDLLGCSISEFIKHIESLWQPGMTWANRGLAKIGGPRVWHIDHIRPCSSFDLTDPEQQRQCFRYMNMQPLWANENLSKGSRIDWKPISSNV